MKITPSEHSAALRMLEEMGDYNDLVRLYCGTPLSCESE